MATVETVEQPRRNWHRRIRRAPEIEESIARGVDFILANIPTRTDLFKMARYGRRQELRIQGTTWVITVENHRVGHNLGLGIPRTRSVVMRSENVALSLVTDWKIKRGIGLMQQRGNEPPFSVGFDPLPLPASITP